MPPPTTCNKRDYIGPVEYYNNTAEAYYHNEGRINLLPGMNKRYEYTLHDHLGNARICFADTNNDGTAEILQQTNYYPFGLPIQKLSPNFEAPLGVEVNRFCLLENKPPLLYIQYTGRNNQPTWLSNFCNRKRYN